MQDGSHRVMEQMYIKTNAPEASAWRHSHHTTCRLKRPKDSHRRHYRNRYQEESINQRKGDCAPAGKRQTA